MPTECNFDRKAPESRADEVTKSLFALALLAFVFGIPALVITVAYHYSH